MWQLQMTHATDILTINSRSTEVKHRRLHAVHLSLHFMVNTTWTRNKECIKFGETKFVSARGIAWVQFDKEHLGTLNHACSSVYRTPENISQDVKSCNSVVQQEYPIYFHGYT
jgi:hypothetical protein